MNSPLYVQYGCGHSAPKEWKNFDASPTLRFERLPVLGKLYSKNPQRFPLTVDYGDIVKGLPVPDGSCHGVYCSHVLEHLSLADFRTALRNTHRLLASGGRFRLVVPDLEYLAKAYLENPGDDAAHWFMRESWLGQEQRGLKHFLRAWLGGSQHLWMWDYKALAAELAASGFTQVRRARFGDSTEARFAEVEERIRWENCLGIECSRP